MTKFAIENLLPTDRSNKWSGASLSMKVAFNRAKEVLIPKGRRNETAYSAENKSDFNNLKQRKRQLLCEPAAEDEHQDENSYNNKQDELKRARESAILHRGSGRLDSVIASSRQEESLAFANKENTSKERGKMSTTFNLISHRRNVWPKNEQDSTSDKYDHHQQRSRRKSELTTLLTVLFGTLLVFTAFTASFQLVNSTTTDITTTPASLNSSSILLASQATSKQIHNSIISNETLSSSSSTESTKPGDDIESGSEKLSDDLKAQPELNNEDSEEDQPNSDNKLGELIGDVGGSGAELLISHLRGNSSSAAASGQDGANNDGDDEESEGASKEQSRANKSGSEPASLETSSTKAQVSEEIAKTEQAGLSEEQQQQLRLAMETYARWRVAADDAIELFSRKLMPLIVEHGYDVDSSTVAGLLQVFNGIRSLKPWALKLLDASAKLGPGVLVGTQSDFGDFDECLNVHVDDPSGLAGANNVDYPVEIDPETGLKSTTLVGRYCLADVEFPKPPRELLNKRAANTSFLAPIISNDWPIDNKWAPIELRRPLLNFSQTAAYKDTIFVETGNFFHMLYVDPIRVGVCLTNKIDPEAFATVFNKLIEHFRVKINFRGRCVTKYDRPKWTKFQQISAYILVAACSLVLLSTMYELLADHLSKQYQHSTPWSLESSKLLAPSSRGDRMRQLLDKNRLLLTSFSLIRNTKRLFRDQRTRSGQKAKVSKSQQECCASSTSSGPESSVESSPSIERRGSNSTQLTSANTSIDGGSSTDLILNGQRRLVLASLASSRTSSSSNSSSSLQDSSSGQQHSINLNCLHGIRVITMTWMIVNHTYMFGGFFVLWAHRRLIDIAEWPKSMSFQLVLNGWLTVETYFFLSALIIVLNVMPLLKANKFNYFAYIIHRLMRLIPAYIGLVSLNFLWPLISNGPVWLVKGKSFVQSPCENYLWTNFLFINNWFWPEKQCMVHTWFLSADFQLYLLAPIVVYLLYRRPVIGHSANLIILVLASVFSGLVIYANELLPTTLINKLEFNAIKQQLSYSYFATYQHMGPYCLGILTGYILNKRPQIKLPAHLNWLLWLTLPPLSFTTLMLTYLWNGAYDEPNLINPSPLVSSLYVAIHRLIWSSLVAWLVFSCATGRVKLLSNFLSHSMFLPFSRLSYSIYLVHLPVIMFRALNLRHTIEWSDQNILWEACGNFIVSIAMGFFLNVAFESPIINIESALFRREPKTKSATTSSNNLHQSLVRQLPDQTQSSANIRMVLQQNANSSKPMMPPNGEKLASIKQQDNQPTLFSGQDNSGRAATSSQETLMNSLSPSISASQEPKQGLSNDISRNPRRHSLKVGALSNLGLKQNVESSLGKWKQRRATSQRRPSETAIDFSMKKPILAEEQDRSSSLSLQRQSLRMRRLERIQALTDPSLISSTSAKENNKDIYNVKAEYRHYAPGSYQQWRRISYVNSSGQLVAATPRPQQYATLARTDRLSSSDHFSQEMPASLQHNEMNNNSHDMAIQQQRQYASSVIVESTRLRKDYYSDSLGGREDNRLVGMNRLLQEQAPISRHMGRYNTLSGPGLRSGDWRTSQFASLQRRNREHIDLRLNHDSRESPYYSNWPRQYQPAQTDGQLLQSEFQSNENLQQSLTKDWQHLQPGSLMIPRIDSSTLRRQTRRHDTTIANSIVEEPAEESSAL